MNTKIVITFPYHGYIEAPETSHDSSSAEREVRRKKLFEKIVRIAQKFDSNRKPIVVVNVDTQRRGEDAAFQGSSISKDVELLRVWSVDTCQMWLCGWGSALDRLIPPGESDDSSIKDARVVLLPGDFDLVHENEDTGSFFSNLEMFVQFQGEPFVIGDFGTGDRYGGKELIDEYGTYPLVANWFPDVGRGIRRLKLRRPRSEFLNISASMLNTLLKQRKFAYEQTLNMLIRVWSKCDGNWSGTVRSVTLGNVADDPKRRHYRECLDQIDRTERMLKMVWREMHEPQDETNQQDMNSFLDRYDKLDRRSSAIRENAWITMHSLLRAYSDDE